MPNVPKTYSIKVNEERMEIEDVISKERNDAEGVIVGDLWGYISDVNDVLVKMFGAKDKSEFMGKHVLEFLVKEEKERAIQNSLDSIVNEQAKKEQYRVRLKNGKEMTVEVTTDLLNNKKGEKIGFIDVIRKISDA